MSSQRINLFSYVVILSVACTPDAAIAARLLALEKRLAGFFPYHELLLISHHFIPEAATFEAISQIPNIRLLTFEAVAVPDILERIALREAIGDAILISFWPGEENEAEILLEALVKNKLRDVDYIGLEFAPGSRKSRWLEKYFARLCKNLIGYAPELSMSASACYSKALAGRLNASQNNTTPVKLSYEVAASKKRVLEAGRKTRDMKKLLHRAFWALEVFASVSPGLLTLASCLCFLSALGSAAYAAYVVLVWIIKSNIAEGWLTNNFVIATMLMLMFFTLGIFAVVGAHILRKFCCTALPAFTEDIVRSDFVKKISSNVETE